jgi:hypothetical protein
MQFYWGLSGIDNGVFVLALVVEFKLLIANFSKKKRLIFLLIVTSGLIFKLPTDASQEIYYFILTR